MTLGRHLGVNYEVIDLDMEFYDQFDRCFNIFVSDSYMFNGAPGDEIPPC